MHATFNWIPCTCELWHGILFSVLTEFTSLFVQERIHIGDRFYVKIYRFRDADLRRFKTRWKSIVPFGSQSIITIINRLICIAPLGLNFRDSDFVWPPSSPTLICISRSIWDIWVPLIMIIMPGYQMAPKFFGFSPVRWHIRCWTRTELNFGFVRGSELTTLALIVPVGNIRHRYFMFDPHANHVICVNACVELRYIQR